MATTRVIMVLAVWGATLMGAAGQTTGANPATPPPGEAAAGTMAVLNGVVLVDAQALIRPEGIPAVDGKPGVTGVEIKGLPFLPRADVERVVAPYFGHELSERSIANLQRDIILLCRAKDHPVVDVFWPADVDVVMGVMQMVVIEGRVGEIRVDNPERKWFKDSLTMGGLRLQSGDAISERQLRGDLNWMNRNADFRSVDATFMQGTNLGSVDVTLKVEDRFPVRVFLGYEDSGNEFVGDHRLLAGAKWGNVFGLDHQLNYQYVTDIDFAHYQAHVMSYVAPLPWRHVVTVFGNYTKLDADFGSQFAGFTQQGENYEGSLRYTVPLPKVARTYNHEFSLGFDFKHTENTLEFGSVPIFDTPTEVAQLAANYRGQLPDRLGATAVGVFGFYSPGGLTDENEDPAFRATRPGATADYLYGRITFERITKLPLWVASSTIKTHLTSAGWDRWKTPVEDCFTLHVRATAQLSDSNLLPSEQLGIGGYATVRGYAERLANGDQGLVVNTELRTPVMRLGNLLGIQNGRDTLQLLAFFDYGTASLKSPNPGDDAHVGLASVGGGVRFQMSEHLSIRFDYGFQLTEKDLDSDSGFRAVDGRVHLGVVGRF